MPDPSEPEQQVRQRREVPQEDASPKKPEYTSEQLALVNRIKSCEDYYEMLEISKDATDSDIKKAYKTMALKVHPDKNKAPGADEATQKLNDAVAVLRDVKKRKQYDKDRLTRTKPNGFSTGYEFHESNENYRYGEETADQQEHRWGGERQQEDLSEFVRVLLKIGIFVIILLSIAGYCIYVYETSYSLSKNSEYPIMRRTTQLNVPYYVRQDFFYSGYHASVRREQFVEEEYISKLRGRCDQEKSYRDSMIWKAKNLGDMDLKEHAQNIKMLSCTALWNLLNYGSL